MIEKETSPIEMNTVTTASTSLTSILQKVFMMMAGGLVVTGITSFLIFRNIEMLLSVAENYWIWAIAEIAVVIFLSGRIQKIGVGTAIASFVVYSILNGITLSIIFLVYALADITSAFFITAGTFLSAALYGKITKKRLDTIGSYLMMGLFGLIIAGIVNIILGNEMLDFIIACVGIVIFIGLTAYDVQKIKSYAELMPEENSAEDAERSNKLVVMGALTLYLDFINIFLKVLTILGRRKK